MYCAVISRPARATSSDYLRKQKEKRREKGRRGEERERLPTSRDTMRVEVGAGMINYINTVGSSPKKTVIVGAQGE